MRWSMVTYVQNFNFAVCQTKPRMIRRSQSLNERAFEDPWTASQVVCEGVLAGSGYFILLQSNSLHPHPPLDFYSDIL